MFTQGDLDNLQLLGLEVRKNNSGTAGSNILQPKDPEPGGQIGDRARRPRPGNCSGFSQQILEGHWCPAVRWPQLRGSDLGQT